MAFMRPSSWFNIYLHIASLSFLLFEQLECIRGLKLGLLWCVCFVISKSAALVNVRSDFLSISAVVMHPNFQAPGAKTLTLSLSKRNGCIVARCAMVWRYISKAIIVLVVVLSPTSFRSLAITDQEIVKFDFNVLKTWSAVPLFLLGTCRLWGIAA